MYLLTVLVIFFGNMNLLPFVDSKPEVDPGDKPLPPRIQIRAILIRCPQHIIPDISKSSRGTSNDDKVISVLRTDDIMRFSGFDKDELLMHSEVKNCKRKMIITMMINNLGRTVTEEEFVVVDHVYDPDLHKRSRLLNPFVFKIKQDPVLQLYGMRYVQSVNAMAKEEVLNKGLNNFTGCDTTSSHPTCGMVYHNNRIVPYSEGFCCSCDSYVNLQRQPGLSIVRQQKIFSDRKGKCFVENKDLNDGDKYYTEKFKRDVNEQNDNFLKRSGNLDVLRSKYMSSDFDFAKNGFYTPQIVRRRNHFGDDFNKLENSEEVSTWERKSRLNNAVFEKGNRILWNNDNLEQIPNADEEEKRDEPVEKKKRSVDGERTESLNSNGIEIVDNGLDKKFQEVDIDNEESLNTVEKKIIDRSDERAERQDARGKANQSVDDVEKIFEDKIEKLQDGEGETNLSLNEIVERDHETKKERSVRDETGNFLQSGMRVTGEKPFLLRPKDWSSLKALKLRVKGLKPVSPLYQCGYQPSHRYVKVQEENRPAMEHAKGFQMSDYRPRWNSNSRIPFKKPGPWDIIPPICSSDKRTKNILRVLTKLNEKLCLTDTVDESVDESKLLDSLMKNIDKSLVRTRRNNVSEIEQPHTNNSQLSDDSSKHEKCEEAWNELQTLLLEQTIDEKRSLQDSSMNKNMIVPDITYNEKDNKMIERLKRQIDRWFDENYEINSLNISNSSIGYGDTAHITNNNDDSFLSNADQNSTLPFGLNRDSLINFNEGDGLENYYNSFFDGPRRYLELKDFDFLNGNRENATNLYEFSERNRKYLGLLPHSQFEKLKPVSNNGFNNITVSNWDEQSKIHDKFLNENRKNLNIALEHPELPQEENNYRRNNLAAFNMNNNDNKIDNVAEGVGDLQKFVLNPPPHFHSKSGPVFIDENRYGPLLDTHPVKLSKTSPNSNSLVSNNSNFIHPFDFSRKIIEVEDNPNSQIKSNSIMIGNNLQEKQILIAAPSELNGENSDKLVRYSDENIQRMNEYPAEQVGSSHDMSGVWNSIEKGSSGPSPQKVIDERNSFFMRSEPESNMRKLDVSRNSDLQNNFNQNADFGTKLGFDSRSFVLDNDRNVNKIVNRNTDNASTNNEIMFDEMPISSNSSFNGSNPSKGNNLSHKSYHIYKQEMESPYVIHTSHAKHKSNFQILKSNGEDSNNERSHFLEVATEFGNPSLLNASDVQHLMQKAMISGSGNLSQSSFHNSSQSPTVPKSSPVLISGNVGNLYGQKGKLIFIPDDPEEQIPPNKQLDIENYQRKYLENVEYGNSKMNLFGESNHVSYPNFTNSETCIAGRPGYGISNFGKNYVNPKYSSYFKNWAGNPDRDSWGTSLPIEELSDSFFNSDNAQLNFINRNIDAKYDINPISSSNRINDGLSAQFKSENRVNIDAPSENSKPALNKFDFKDDKTSILENDVIEKRDTEKSGSRSKKNTKKVRRQVSSNGNQIRGGQNCIDRYVPPGANPITYHESAHCLRFSDLWYSVYTIKKPNLDHSLQLHLYEKNNFPQATHWEELTRGITTDLGTGNRHIEDGYSTLSFTYIPLTDLMRGDFCLDEHRATLLVPESLPPALAAKYPQLSGSANEYLLVQSDDISLEGDECNKVGTSFEGFATQPDRCTQPRGTCLQNQPIDMWTHDIMARDEGRPGKFFLENYAVVAEQPLLVNQSSQEQSLALEYYRQFSTIIEVEVKSDLNAIVRTGESGQLSEVFVDSSCHSNTKLTVIVTNQGLASSAYYPKLSNCPVELPEVWTHNVGPLVMIAPQHRHIFQMTMYGELAVDRFHCSVELMNDKKELVATRRVRIQKHDRCICVWHCLCACTASTEGLSCEPMSMPHYHAAGFQGSLPVVHLHPETGSEKILKIILPILIVVWFSLLIGLIKAIFGLCCTIVGAYGLWAVCKGRSKNLSSYNEDDLKDFDVERDVQGYAIHPTQQTRNIKLFNKIAEFFINIFYVFLLIWQLIVFLLCCCCQSDEDNADDKFDEESGESSESETEMNDLEDESVTVNSVIEERRRCEEDIKGYNVDLSNQCLIFVDKPKENDW